MVLFGSMAVFDTRHTYFVIFSSVIFPEFFSWPWVSVEAPNGDTDRMVFVVVVVALCEIMQCKMLALHLA